MKNYIKVALVAVLALLPYSFASALPISDALKDSVTQVVATPSDSVLQSQLTEALKLEIKAQGLSNVCSIAEQVLASAKDEASARALAEAVATAALVVASELQADLNVVASDIGSCIAAGTSPSLVDDAVEAAAAAAAKQGSGLEDIVINSASGVVEVPEIILPSGDAGETPSVDISTGTAVNN